MLDRSSSGPNVTRSRLREERKGFAEVAVGCFWHACCPAYLLRLGRSDGRRPGDLNGRCCAEVFLFGFDVDFVVMRAVTEKWHGCRRSNMSREG